MNETDVKVYLLRLLGALLAVLVNSILVAASQHPGDDKGFWPAVLRAMGRASLLRHDDAPGTLHLPGYEQPEPPARIVAASIESRPDTPPPTPRPGSGRAVLRLLVLALLTAMGCAGASLEATERALAGTLQAQTAAVSDFAAWDQKHQMALVATARTRAEAAQRLAAYRQDRGRLRELLLRSSLALDTAIVNLGLAAPAPAPSAPAASGGPGGGR